MDIIEDKTPGNQVTAYEPGKIVTNKGTHHHSLIISPNSLTEVCELDGSETLTPEIIKQLLATDAEVVIVGTGTEQVFPDAQLYAKFAQHNMGIEIMNTPAACRTYNILMAELRKVVAVLIL